MAGQEQEVRYGLAPEVETMDNMMDNANPRQMERTN